MPEASRTSTALHAQYLKRIPTQDEIDALGGGKTIRDWEASSKRAYQKCKDEDVTLVGGVAPTATRFAKYLKKDHGVYPKDLWQTQIVTLGSVPGINTRYRPALRADCTSVDRALGPTSPSASILTAAS